MTRATPESAAALQAAGTGREVPRERALRHRRAHADAAADGVTVVCAGTADLPVAEEAAITAEMTGNDVRRMYDVGVAGIHRLLDQLPVLREARVLVVVAGMEGALPSVVAGW